MVFLHRNKLERGFKILYRALKKQSKNLLKEKHSFRKKIKKIGS
jgi:hypothetical protein